MRYNINIREVVPYWRIFVFMQIVAVVVYILCTAAYPQSLWSDRMFFAQASGGNVGFFGGVFWHAYSKTRRQKISWLGIAIFSFLASFLGMMSVAFMLPQIKEQVTFLKNVQSIPEQKTLSIRITEKKTGAYIEIKNTEEVHEFLNYFKDAVLFEQSGEILVYMYTLDIVCPQTRFKLCAKVPKRHKDDIALSYPWTRGYEVLIPNLNIWMENRWYDKRRKRWSGLPHE